MRQARKIRWLGPIAAALALLGGSAALASDSVVRVSIAATGAAGLDLGQATKVTATARLPKGAHLLIRASRGGAPAAKLVECLRSPCSASFRDGDPEDVGFQAFAIRHVGRKVTILGRSRIVEVVWSEPTPPAPPAPPPPAATPGHYSGTIGNAKSPVNFDIGADGVSLTNWTTGEIDESCDPATYTFWFTSLHDPGPFTVAQDGSFTISGAESNLAPPLTAYSITFTGKVTGTTASGILRVESSYQIPDGTSLNCSSGDQPWTATKTG